MSSRTPQAEGIRLHHRQKRRQLLLLSALCGGYAKVCGIEYHKGLCVVHVNEKRFECALDDNGLPHVSDELAARLENVMYTGDPQ